MYEFTWHMTISFLLLFFILSSSIFFYTKEKSFKYYALYNLFLIVYILTKKTSTYIPLQDFVTLKFGSKSAANLLSVGNWYIQTIFYSFYALFAMSFVDLDVHVSKLFNLAKKLLAILMMASTTIMIYALVAYNIHIYYNFFLYIFVPLILCISFFMLPIAIKYSGKHKHFLIIGVLFYIFFALLALFVADYSNLFFGDSVIFFFIGIIIESIFFSIGIAFKIKIINDEKNNHKNEIIIEKHNHQISKLESFIEGEEKERLRIAKELHDGLNGDLSAIKFKLSSLLEMNNGVIKEAITMIDNSCNQVRAISHNLVPPSLENFNLLEAVEEYCEKYDASHSQKITFQYLGDAIKISKKEEINIFRIIQELVANSIKHAEAVEVNVQISCRNRIMQIIVEDNGKGFDVDNVEGNGIGLKNIQSRVDYLHGSIDLISNKQGTSTTIEIDRNDNN